MLESVDVGVQCIDCYEVSAGRDPIDSLRALAEPLEGARVLHLNATPYGGGVAEILRSEIPLLRDLGLKADWKIITGDQTFFSVTKKIHNGLQGASDQLTEDERQIYINSSIKNAKLLEDEYDLLVVHDPQPLALLHFHGKGTSKWVWRCHIDTSEPNSQIWNFLRSYLEGYDAAVFTLGSFVPPDLPLARVDIIPPAIDPESPKNIELSISTARRVLQWIGVEIDKPLITQVSRFDPWKDPLGVIDAYKLVRQDVSNLQLALAGSMALDDPEGWEIYSKIQASAKNDRNIHIFTNLTGVGNIEVNAFQNLSDVVIQKSIREGFGLVVSETLWKGTPVVAGRAGGIPIQMQEGAGGFLVNSVEECAEKTLWLLRNPEDGKKLGMRGKEIVRKRFLLTRLIADELKLYTSLLDTTAKFKKKESTLTAYDETKDPVCGMQLNQNRAASIIHEGEEYYFCSASCIELFKSDPSRFLRARKPEP
jgi:trehalose synthase